MKDKVSSNHANQKSPAELYWQNKRTIQWTTIASVTMINLSSYLNIISRKLGIGRKLSLCS